MLFWGNSTFCLLEKFLFELSKDRKWRKALMVWCLQPSVPCFGAEDLVSSPQLLTGCVPVDKSLTISELQGPQGMGWGSCKGLHAVYPCVLVAVGDAESLRPRSRHVLFGPLQCV